MSWVTCLKVLCHEMRVLCVCINIIMIEYVARTCLLMERDIDFYVQLYHESCTVEPEYLETRWSLFCAGNHHNLYTLTYKIFFFTKCIRYGDCMMKSQNWQCFNSMWCNLLYQDQDIQNVEFYWKYQKWSNKNGYPNRKNWKSKI